ncbi:RNA polymerase I enhancer binding protein [Xylographa pallens]|nr:RNA polymerase I enhancer binding protein [Xylographa pallens]
MNVPYVCIRCRQRANHILRPLKGRSFVSLSPSSIKPDDTNSAVQATDKQENKRTAKAQDGKAKAKVVDSSRRGKPLESVNSMLERLFISTRRARPDLPVKSRYSQTLNPTYVLVDGNPSNILKNGLTRDRQETNGGKEAKDTVAASQERSSPNDHNEQFMINKEISITMVPTGPKSPSIRRLLQQATKESDAKLALKLWKRQVKQMSTDGKIDNWLFIDFLRTFFAVARPDCATEVWNTMCKHGYKPTAMHWVALLEGCRKTQDLGSLKSIWQRMAAAEMQNTNQAWTVYISGLLQCKDWRSALTAVANLGEAWKLSNAPTASESTEAGTTTKQQIVHEADQFAPSIVPINAAISGLLGNRKRDLAKQILTWAISENIKPDTTTFNILLRPAVRYNDTEGVQRILAEMKQHACDPDVVTFTILIDGIFRNPASAFQTQSPEAQQAVIVRVFKDMQDNHIKATAQTYTTILDGLLHPKYFNLPAARAVLARMTDHGIRLTPHIYTILVTHYFSLDPPDLHAIDSLWRRIELEKARIDHILYDRMIEGYGRVGVIDRMLAVLRRMPGEGKRPGWIALLGALRALALAEEWGLVADLVRDVANEKEGLLRFGSRGWRGKEEFWELVEVLRGRGVEMPGRGGVGEDEEEDGGEGDGQEQDGGEEDGGEEDGQEEDGQEEDGQEEDGQEEDGRKEDGEVGHGGEERSVVHEV